MTRSLSSNLVKYFFTNLSQDEEKRVIDSNEAVRRRLEKLVEEGIIPSQSGEMQSENGEFVAGLAAETIEAPDSGSNILKAQDEAKEILSQAEAGGVVNEPVDAQLTAHVKEEVVAGDLNGLGDIDQAVLAPVLPVNPALGAVGGVVGVPALVPDLGGGGDDALLLQTGHGGDHLEGGAWGIGPLEGPV